MYLEPVNRCVASQRVAFHVQVTRHVYRRCLVNKFTIDTINHAKYHKFQIENQTNAIAMQVIRKGWLFAGFVDLFEKKNFLKK
jgi:hypothetical protein